jgi:hypothetical protein
MSQLDKLPTADDGAEGLLGLAAAFGTKEAFQFLTLVRNQGNADANLARSVMAQQMLDALMEKEPHLDRDAARRRLADSLGYSDTTRTNFYKVLDYMPRRGGTYKS